jgi:hypothetical protein
MTEKQKAQREKAYSRSCGVCAVCFYFLQVLCYNNLRQLKKIRSLFELFTVYPLIVSAERTRKGAGIIQGVCF